MKTSRLKEPERVTLPGTSVHRIRSDHLPQMLRVEVGLPLGYETSKTEYPTVYVIDGHWYFPGVFHAADSLAVAEEIPPVLVVGIGYEPASASREAEAKRITQLRCRDLTPTHDPTDWWRVAGAPQALTQDLPTGWSAKFLAALESEVKPLVRGRYRVRRGDETLAGFSLGGLFALEVLFCRPRCFQRYLAGSPALWWDQRVLFQYEEDWARRHRDLAKCLFVSVGDLEETGTAARAHMVRNVLALARRLRKRKYPRLESRFLVLAGHTHATAAAPAFARGLKAVYECDPGAKVWG